MRKWIGILRRAFKISNYLRGLEEKHLPRIVVITSDAANSEIISFLLTGKENSNLIEPILFSELERNPKGSGKKIRESDITIIYSKNPFEEAEMVATASFFASRLTPAWSCFLLGERSSEVGKIISEVIERDGTRILAVTNSEELSRAIIQTIFKILLNVKPAAISEIKFLKSCVAKNLPLIEARLILKALFLYSFLKESALPLVIEDVQAAYSILKNTAFEENELLAKLVIALPLLGGMTMQRKGSLSSNFFKSVIITALTLVFLLYLIPRNSKDNF